MQPAFWRRGCRTAGWIRHLFGWAILPTSTQPPSLDWWIASLAATRASPTVLPAAVRGPTTIDFSSTKCSASCASYGHIVSSAKTYLGTPTGNSPHWSRHWSGWATSLRLEFSQREKSAPATSANASLLWPTATCPAPHDSEQSVGRYRPARAGYGMDLTQAAHELPKNWSTPRANEMGDYTQDKGDPTRRRLSLTGEAKEWQTPATDSFRCRGGDRKDEMGLDQQARLWPTPQAHDHHPGVSERVGRYGTEHGGRDLTDEATSWMTPSAGDGRRGGMDPTRADRGAGSAMRPEQAAQWPTPAARDYRSPNSAESRERRNKDKARGQQLMNFIADEMRAPHSQFSPLAPPIQDGQKSLTTRHILNPQFVEWLLGWPRNYTRL